ncbi:MAG: hypothetical protein R3E09_11525 [Novosphingobium sp.]
MNMPPHDFTSGLRQEADLALVERPSEAFWSENYLFALYDAGNDIGMWLHLGTVPTDWSFWEDRIYMSLPKGRGVLSSTSYSATQKCGNPGGAVMQFECHQPFKRWAVRFDGFVLHTSEESMEAGDGTSYRKRLTIDLEVTCVTPVWDARSAPGENGKSGMDAQSWAKEHYEQLVIAKGEAVLDGEVFEIHATGWRDHSRGPRGGNTREPWGGHVIVGCQFPGGRKFLFSRYWRPDGGINLAGGMIIDDKGDRHVAEIVDAPELTELVLRGETLPLHLKWQGGELQTSVETVTSIWIPRERKHTVGRDRIGALNDMYVLNWGPVWWDDEVGHAYVERSAHLNALPKKVGA